MSISAHQRRSDARGSAKKKRSIGAYCISLSTMRRPLVIASSARIETDEEKVHLLPFKRGTFSYNPAKRHEYMGKIQWECKEEKAKRVHKNLIFILITLNSFGL